MTARLIALSIALLQFVVVGCGPTEKDVRRIVNEEMRKGLERTTVSPMEVIGPYSPAVRVGGFLFVSGQIGLDRETGQLQNTSIESETRQVMENLMHILRSAGYDSSHVVSATVYLKNMNDYAKMNLIYGGYFPEESYPARATVAVNELPRQANVEIAVVAYK